MSDRGPAYHGREGRWALGEHDVEQGTGGAVPDTAGPRAAPVAHARSAFADAWLAEHRYREKTTWSGNQGRTDVSAFTGAEQVRDALGLPSPQREEVMAELQRLYGNTYVAQALAGAVPGMEAQKAKEPAEVPTILSWHYWEKYGRSMLPQAVTRASVEAQVSLVAPGVTLTSPAALVSTALAPHAVNPDYYAVSELLDTNLEALIDGVRVLDEHGFGADQWEPVVVDRLVERMVHEVRRAVDQLALPYAKARARVVAAAQAETSLGGLATPHSVVLDPRYAEPVATSLGADRPIEASVAAALCSGVVDFDPVAFELHPDAHIPGGEAPGEPEPVEIMLERGRGDWMTVSVLTGPATARDVATALYGTPALAHLVVGSGSRFGFGFPPGKHLAEPYDTEWANHLVDEGYGVVDMIGLRSSTDPFLALDDQTADAAALDAAKGHPAPLGQQAKVVQNIAIMEDLVATIGGHAASLGVAGLLGATGERLRARREACASDPAEADRWAAQSAVQLDTLAQARDGFESLAGELMAMGLPAVCTSDGDELVGEVTEQMAIPARELAAMWARVVAASEDAGASVERLALARERLDMYPFDMVDRALAVVQARMGRIASAGDMLVQTIEPARIAAIHAELAAAVSRFRIAMTNGDGTAVLQLQALRGRLAMLDLHSSVGATMGAIRAVQDQFAYWAPRSPERDQRQNLAARINRELTVWYPLVERYDALWRSGADADPATIDELKRQLAQHSDASELPALIQQIGAFAEDEAERQRFIRIYNIVVFAVASALTGGLASAALGGGIVGGLAGATVEALTFTGLTQMMNDDPTWGGFFAELGLNFATFGGLRAIGGGAKIMAAGKATLTGKALELGAEGLWMTAAAKVHEQIQQMMASGATITSHDAGQLFAENLLMAFAGRVAGRVGGAVFDRFKALPEAERAIQHRLAAGQIADDVLQNKNLARGEELAKADTASLKADADGFAALDELAANPARAKQLGIEIDDVAAREIAEQAAATHWQIKDQEIAALNQRTTAHGDHLIAEAAVYDDLLAKHKEIGSSVAETFDAAGSRRAVVRPKRADGSFGPAQTLHVQGSAPSFGWTADLQPGQVTQVLRQLGEPLSSKISAGDAAFTGAELAATADLVMAARATPNIRGVDDWIAFETAQNAAHARDAVGELRSALRRSADEPGTTFEIAQDAHAPVRPGTRTARNPDGDRMKSFDITASKDGRVDRSIEITSAEAPVKSPPDLTKAVKHAASEKAASRLKEKPPAPIPGEREVEIRMEFYVGDDVAGHNGKVVYDGAGNYTYTVNGGAVTPKKFGQWPNPGNILDNMETNLPRIGDIEQLDFVTLVDASGNVIARFEKANGWKRMK
jgi:hypothetical protein